MKASTLTKIAEDPVENEASKKSIRWAPQVGKRKRARVIWLDKQRPPSQGGTLSKGKQLSASKKSTSENAKKKFKVQKEYKNIHSTKPPRNPVQKEGTSNTESKRNVAEMKSQDQKMTGQSPVQKKVKEDSFSPTSNSVFKSTSVSQNKVLDKDGKTAGLTKWKIISKLPEISSFQNRRSLGDMRPPSPEDALGLPFGGTRNISDSSLLTANKATNVIYTINQARKKRLKESINAQIAAVHERVRWALEYADIYEEDTDTKDQEPEGMFNTRTKRETMKHRSELIYKLREHIEECHQRMVLISDVNNWMQIQQKELDSELISEEEMDETSVELNTMHKKIIYSLESFTNCTNRIISIGQKLIDIVRKVLHARSKGKVEKIHVIDEKTMLSNKVKWDEAVASIMDLFDDAARWVKGVPFKAALRNGKKQYQVLISAVDKRLAELNQMSRLNEDLQNELLMSKEMIAKYSKDADDYRRMVDRLSSELQEVKAQMTSSLEANKNLTSQLSVLEGQVKEKKEELAEPTPLPPRIPTPPLPSAPQPPQPSDTSNELRETVREKTRKQLQRLEQELQEYRMLVKNLRSRIDELEQQLSKEQEFVKFLKESMEIHTQSAASAPRGPEPVVEMPPERAPPQEIAGDPSSNYYKTLMSGMKRDFMLEVDKLKEHLKKEQSRNHASVRRLEQIHKDQIQTIMKDCMRVLRGIIHFRDQVANTLDKEGFGNAAQQLHQLPKLILDNVNQDPKEVLLYLAANTIDYLHNIEVVLNHTMLAIKVKQNAGTVGSHPPIDQNQVFRQMEVRMEEIRKTSKIRDVMKSPVKRANARGRRKDRQQIRRLQGRVSQFENKYMCLLDRYKLVWNMYNKQQKDIDKIQADFDQTVKKKVKEKQNSVVTAIKTEFKERRAYQEQQLHMSISDQRRNLHLLHTAFEENRISHELHSMASSLLHQALEIPRKRFRYLIERYIAHCALKEAESNVTTVFEEEKLSDDQRLEIKGHMEDMQHRLHTGLSLHHPLMQKLEAERRLIFKQILQVFNEVLIETGVLLIQPIFKDNSQEVTKRLRSVTKRKRMKTIKAAPCRMQVLDLSSGIVGSTIPLTFKDDQPMWQTGPSELVQQPVVTTPNFLNLEVNQHRLQAKRTLQCTERRHYPMAQSRSFTITNEMKVDYITTALLCP
ncbi:putative leucine-rich repeat-containing protein DDB_G0290503 isoform X2 [Haliotis cracherodii]